MNLEFKLNLNMGDFTAMDIPEIASIISDLDQLIENGSFTVIRKHHSMHHDFVNLIVQTKFTGSLAEWISAKGMLSEIFDANNPSFTTFSFVYEDEKICIHFSLHVELGDLPDF